MRKILDVLRDSERKISQILLFLIIVLVFTASIFRTFGHPIVWSVDMAQLLFVWLCFLGADIALQHNCHIGVDILTRALPKKINTVIVFCSYLLILGFLVIIVIFGTYLALKNSHRLFNGMPISYSWATISAPVGCLLLSITIIEKLIGILSPSQPGKKEDESLPQPQNAGYTESCD